MTMQPLVSDVFQGLYEKDVEKLLDDSHLLAVMVPSNCTDQLQPPDLSIYKAVKDQLHQFIIYWYASEVNRQITLGKSIQHVNANTQLSVTN